jgi:hypothetical protein
MNRSVHLFTWLAREAIKKVLLYCYKVEPTYMLRTLDSGTHFITHVIMASDKSVTTFSNGKPTEMS